MRNLKGRGKLRILQISRISNLILKMLANVSKAIICLFTCVLFFENAVAGDFEEVQSALQRKNFGVAVKLLQPIAEQGDSKAQAFLAYVTISRNDVPKDFQAAASWAKKAAGQGDAMGKVLLGMLYLNGQGVLQDEEQAISLISQSAASNNPLGMYELGKLMLVGRSMARDVNEGEALLKAAAARFADLKDYAELLVRNSAELDKWRSGSSRLSCEGFACAGRLGSNRQKMKGDYETMMWVELAARVLDVGFRNDLVYFYLGRASEGIGDLPQALIYYNLAINPKQFGIRCDFLINNCDGIVLPRDASDRRSLVTAAIQQNSKREVERLALAETARIAAEAAEATRLAAEQEALRLEELAKSFVADRKNAEGGSREAQYRLAQMYFGVKGVLADEKTGLSWLVKSAQQGYAAAQYDLGERFRTGSALPQDNVKAEIWFRKAMQQGYADTDGGLAALLTEKQARANTVADAAKKRAVAAAAIEKNQEEEKAELLRKTKTENAAKLKSL